MLLESLLVCVPSLSLAKRLTGFLQEAALALTSALPDSVPTLTAYLKGLGGVLAAGLGEEGVEPDVRATLRYGLHILWSLVCEAVEEMRREKVTSTLAHILHHPSLWKEMARCVDLTGTPGPQLSSKQPHVGVALSCAQVSAGYQPFTSVSSSLEWVLDALAEGGSIKKMELAGKLGDFVPLFHLVLKTLHFCCSTQHKNSILHQTELLHMLSVYTRRRSGVSDG